MPYSVFGFHVSEEKKASLTLFTFSQNCPFCLEDCKTFLFILEPKFLMKQTKDMLSEVPKERVGLSKRNTKLGTGKLLEAPGLST